MAKEEKEKSAKQKDENSPQVEKTKAAEESVDEGETRPKEYYEYELYGIVVHSGTADTGHYYSFIREDEDHSVDEESSRENSPQNAHEKKESSGDSSVDRDDWIEVEGAGRFRGRWLEFNDKKVAGFDLQSLAEECFGGEQVR